MLSWARTRKSRWRNDVSSNGPVNRPRTAISKRSRPAAERMPVRAMNVASDVASHSAARRAVHGASRGTRLAIRSMRSCDQAIDATASGLILGMSPL